MKWNNKIKNKKWKEFIKTATQPLSKESIKLIYKYNSKETIERLKKGLEEWITGESEDEVDNNI